MPVKSTRYLVLLVCLSLTSAFCTATGATTEPENKETMLSLDEIQKKRRAARAELMLPSLKGLRGLSYRVVGFKDYRPLEKLMGKKLEQTNLPIVPFLEMKEGQRPVDAMVQVTFYRTGGHTVAELKVTQWVSLLREPKSEIRAVTYSEKFFSAGAKPEEIVDQLTNQFVLDFLKANQQTGTTAKTSRPTKPQKEASAKSKK